MTPSNAAEYAESSDTFTAKQGFFDRTLALHTERLGVSCRVQADARFQISPRLETRIGDLALTENAKGTQDRNEYQMRSPRY